MKTRRAPLLLLLLILAACKAAEGPRIPLPDQDVSGPAPEGKTRILFYNTSNKALYWETGMIRIRLNGHTVPSLWLGKYVQVVVEPGDYKLLLEHFDLFNFRNVYDVTLPPGDVYLEVYCRPISTKYRQVDALPANFERQFRAARDPLKWNAQPDREP